MDDLLQIFLDEASTNIENLCNTLVKLEEKNDMELFQEAKRYAHSIKGGASFFGYMSIVELAKHIETIFKLAMDSKIEFDSSLIEALKKSIKFLREMISNYEKQHEVNDLIHYLDENTKLV